MLQVVTERRRDEQSRSQERSGPSQIGCGAYQASAELIIVPACEDFTIVGGGAQECYTREVKERPVPSTSRVEEHVGHMKQIHT